MTTVVKETTIKRPRLASPDGLPGVIRSSGPVSWAVLIAAIGALVGVLATPNQAFNWSFALCSAVFAMGCGITLSWGRIAAFGQGLFYSAGGYTAALIVPWHLPAVLVVVAGAVVAAVIAFAFSLITIRLDFSSFAMLTLVIGQAGNQLILTLKSLGGENGLYGIRRPNYVGGESPQDDKSFYFYCLTLLVVVVFLGRWFYQSTSGRAVRAVRDDAIRAQALGINVNRNRVLVYTVGAFVCGVGGAMYGQLQSVVDPSMGNFNQSTEGVMMVVLGGLGTFLGPVVGGIIFQWLDHYTSQIVAAPDLWLGLVFIGVVMLTPVVTMVLRRWRSGSSARRRDGGGSAPKLEVSK